MIVYGQDGKGKGKLGSSVYSINHGVQVKREYNGSVANPNTPAQVTTRSRFKLASQVSAALAPVIVFPRKGMSSPRNQFVKRNFVSFYGTVDGSSVSYENLQLTIGNLGLPAVSLERLEGKLIIKLAESAGVAFARVVYCIFKKTTESQLQYVDSYIVDVSGADQTFSTSIVDISGDLIVYAYGIRDNNGKASTRFANYQVKNGTDIATLVASRKLSLTDYSFSQTRGNMIFAGDNVSTDATEGTSNVYLTIIGNGQVTAQGVTFRNGRANVTNGTQITLTADPAAGWELVGWVDNRTGAEFANTSTITIVVDGMRDIVCQFDYTGNFNGME